jgi:hypothetical protein
MDCVVDCFVQRRLGRMTESREDGGAAGDGKKEG